MKKSLVWGLTFITAALALTACGVSLSQDITPPPGATLPTPAPATKTVLPVPTILPTATQQPVKTTPTARQTGEVKTSEPILLSFAGKVTSPGGAALAMPLEVELQIYDAEQQLVNRLTTQISADGSFSFENVEGGSDQVYAALVNYYGLSFHSEVIHNADLSAYRPLDVSIQVPETTSDTSSLSAERLHIFFDFSKTGVVQVAELYILHNPTGKIIIPAEEGAPVLLFNLPQGAVNLQFQEGALGGRYIQTANGFGDTQAVGPEDGQQVLFGFDLPAQDVIAMSLPLAMPVEEAVVMLPEGTMNLESSQLSDLGEREMDNSTIHLYMGSNLPAGEPLQISLSQYPTGVENIINLPTVWVIVLAVAGIGTAAAGLYLWIRNRKTARTNELGLESGETEEGLLDAILALDDQYQAGSLDVEAYEARRAELKQRLIDMRGKR